MAIAVLFEGIGDSFMGGEWQSLFDAGKGDRVLWVLRGDRCLVRGNRRSGLWVVKGDRLLIFMEGRFNLKLLISTQMDCCLANKFVPYI